MAIGVPETEVFAAADRVLGRGERPTVERVRAELGRGSPARVGSLLESWWEALARRLASEKRLPDLPPEVATAFRQTWQVAVDSGLVHAETQYSSERDALAVAQERLNTDQEEWKARLEVAQSAIEQAQQERDAAIIRQRDLQQVIDLQTNQLADATRQREALQQQCERAQQELGELAARLAAQDAAANQERQAATIYTQNIENRAHAEVDRAREETKTIQEKVRLLERELAREQKQALTQRKEAQSALRVAERLAVTQAARADALERRLDRLDSSLLLANKAPPSRAKSLRERRQNTAQEK